MKIPSSQASSHFLISLSLVLLAQTPASAAFKFFNPADRESVPRLLSLTGIYSDIAAKIPDTSLKYFEINSALWSDGAAKKRWIILPPGKSVAYQNGTDLFEYPDSTVFVKTFLLDRVEGDSGSRVYWETRLLMNRKDDLGNNSWHGLSYKWNASASEAALVDPDIGFDTAFYYHPQGAASAQSYKKWHFPSQSDCNLCHQARHVLGFLPAQLKRPSPSEPSLDQIRDLFRKGVFTGSPPTENQLRDGWKGIREVIPAGLSPDERFAMVDSMARAYLAANCSGCHGDRGISQRAAPSHVNFDFFRLVPAMELGNAFADPLGLGEEDSSESPLAGRRYYIEAVAKAGLDTGSGKVWNMARPQGSRAPNLLYPGYPAYSMLLYRQFVRKSAWRDSSEAREYLDVSGDPEGWRFWIFSQPWGSESWRSQLASHGVDPGDLFHYQKDGGQVGGQMPPVISSFIPDRQALSILGEWVRNYRSLYPVDPDTGKTGAARRDGKGGQRDPMLRGRVLFLPQESVGEVRMSDLQGRTYRLRPDGEGRFSVPDYIRPGIYVFRAGNRRFLACLSE